MYKSKGSGSFSSNMEATEVQKVGDLSLFSAMKSRVIIGFV
jgi:hypothetical protein